MYSMSPQRLSVWLVTILAMASVINSENILVLMTVPSYSHHIWFRALVMGMAQQKNFNITMLSIETETDLPANVHCIPLENVMAELDRNCPPADLVAWIHKAPYEELAVLNDYCNSACTGAFKSNGIKTILNYPDNFKFDLVVYDFTCGPCFLFLLKKFNYPPMVAATAFSNPPYTLDLVGGHNYYAYFPYYDLYYDSEMTFFQRTYNLVMFGLSYLNRHYRQIPFQDAIVRQNVAFDFPYLADLERKTILAFINTHPSIEVAEPLPPNVIAVGGLQIQTPKQLSKDLEDFIAAADKGVVLFCLGTNIRSDMLGDEVVAMFLQVFSELPEYNFLWKFETDTLPAEPTKNVLIRPWLPQNDILAHRRTVAFISHSGLLSTQEAVWNNVPIVGVPFLADQHKNSYKSERAGLAQILHYESLSVRDIKAKLLAVLSDPSYRNQMKITSDRFRDQPEKPLDRALWWINWVLRNPTPEHILSPTLKLGFIRSNIYDILGVFVITVAVLAYCLVKLVKLCRQSVRKQTKKHKKQ